MKEVEFQSSVIDLGRACGWKIAHFRAARTDRGWRTPVQADGAGWPDLTMCRAPELMIVELKAERGRLNDNQRAWLQALEMCGVEVYVWKPSDWPTIEARLTAPRKPLPDVSRSGAIHWTGLKMAKDAA